VRQDRAHHLLGHVPLAQDRRAQARVILERRVPLVVEVVQ
jgi:hypothetical protein